MRWRRRWWPRVEAPRIVLWICGITRLLPTATLIFTLPGSDPRVTAIRSQPIFDIALWSRWRRRLWPWMWWHWVEAPRIMLWICRVNRRLPTATVICTLLWRDPRVTTVLSQPILDMTLWSRWVWRWRRWTGRALACVATTTFLALDVFGAILDW